MPSANQCELISVFVRYTDTTSHGGVPEESIVYSQSFDLCLELEAGRAIFDGGSQYNLFVVLNDLSYGSKIVYTNMQAGSLGDSNWQNMYTTFSWTVPAGSVPLVDGHVYQAIAVMSVGGHDSIVNSGQSRLFIITQL
jgi:hypothetical protein